MAPTGSRAAVLILGTGLRERDRGQAEVVARLAFSRMTWPVAGELEQ